MSGATLPGGPLARYPASMPHKLTVSISRLRQDGWTLPRFRHATERRHVGILLIRQELIDDRYVRVARLVDPCTGAELEGLPRLLNVELVSQTAEEMLLAGIERVDDLGRSIDRAQEWRVAFAGREQVD